LLVAFLLLVAAVTRSNGGDAVLAFKAVHPRADAQTVTEWDSLGALTQRHRGAVAADSLLPPNGLEEVPRVALPEMRLAMRATGLEVLSRNGSQCLSAVPSMMPSGAAAEGSRLRSPPC
jgi:hypothetical protein